MNIYESDILLELVKKPYSGQRALSEASGHSIGIVNQSLKQLINRGYLSDTIQMTAKARETVQRCAPRNAIILAAGLGMRMVPMNQTAPKALLKVKGERLIDRIIRQLHDVGIYDITVVVGFMMESLEYLIDEYGVELVVNPDYAESGNIHSLALVADRIHNTYIIPCDIWCGQNPFRPSELYSWYMVSDRTEEGTGVRVNRKNELVTIPTKSVGNTVIGISYLLEPQAAIVRNRLKAADQAEQSNQYWEEILYKRDRMIVYARVVRSTDCIEINTYEQLRNLDSNSNHLKSSVMNIIASSLKCGEKDIVDIEVMKKGMTNSSFRFRVRNGIFTGKYIMRIPGAGTERLINRRQEAEVYQVVADLGFCDKPFYLNSENGYKITKYLEGVRTCDPEDEKDLKRCMEMLRNLHGKNLKVDHTFDLFDQIQNYENLWEGAPSIYRDHQETKERVWKLKSFIDGVRKDWCLTHIDAVPDNFLFYPSADGGQEQLQLTDWEYSGMQDPHVDIAMFCIYSLYDKERCDRLIDIYFQNACDRITRAKIYAYISVCGLLWSNWCEYKKQFGIEFGEYSLRQYRYAKEYYRHAMKLIEAEEK